MRFVLKHALMVCFFLFFCTFSAEAATGTAGLPDAGGVNGPQGQALIERLREGQAEPTKRLVVLDVRTPEEFTQGHVPGALLIPLQELEARMGEIPEGVPVLIVCRTGRRAATAYDMIFKARPQAVESGLWYLKATPEYKPDGSFVFP